MMAERRRELGEQWDLVCAGLAATHNAGQADSPETYDEEQRLLGAVDHIEYELGEAMMGKERAK
jgi:hypothetical protein